MAMRHYRDVDPEDTFPYDRPSVSSWVAVAAVAFTVFVLGGFLKVYFQVEVMVKEAEKAQKELRDLRQTVDRLVAADSARRSASVGGGERPSLDPLPAPGRNGRRDGDTATSGGESTMHASGEGRSARPVGGSNRPLGGTPPDLLVDSGRKDRSGITYEVGRRSAPERRQAAEPLQIIAFGSGKRVIIEGGRDRGLVPGARLELTRNGVWIGEMRVFEVNDAMSVCEVIHASEKLQLTDSVRIP